MPIATMAIGYPVAIAQTTAYALPAKVCRIHSTAALEVSVDGVTYAVLASSTTGVDVSASFVRCTGSTATVVCKVY